MSFFQLLPYVHSKYMKANRKNMQVDISHTYNSLDDRPLSVDRSYRLVWRSLNGTEKSKFRPQNPDWDRCLDKRGLAQKLGKTWLPTRHIYLLVNKWRFGETQVHWPFKFLINSLLRRTYLQHCLHWPKGKLPGRQKPGSQPRLSFTREPPIRLFKRTTSFNKESQSI